jgi:hypothetical protein
MKNDYRRSIGGRAVCVAALALALVACSGVDAPQDLEQEPAETEEGLTKSARSAKFLLGVKAACSSTTAEVQKKAIDSFSGEIGRFCREQNASARAEGRPSCSGEQCLLFSNVTNETPAKFTASVSANQDGYSIRISAEVALGSTTKKSSVCMDPVYTAPVADFRTWVFREPIFDSRAKQVAACK